MIPGTRRIGSKYRSRELSLAVASLGRPGAIAFEPAKRPLRHGDRPES